MLGHRSGFWPIGFVLVLGIFLSLTSCQKPQQAKGIEYVESKLLPKRIPRQAEDLIILQPEYQDLIERPYSCLDELLLQAGGYRSAINVLKRQFYNASHRDDTVGMEVAIAGRAILYTQMQQATLARRDLNRLATLHRAGNYSQGSMYYQLAVAYEAAYISRFWIIADSYFEMAREIALAIGDSVNWVIASLELSRVRIMQDQQCESHQLIREVKPYVRRAKRRDLLIALLVAEGVKLAECNKTDLAQTKFQQAYGLADRVGAKFIQANIMRRLSDAHRRTGNAQAIYQYAEQATRLQQEIHDEGRYESFRIHDQSALYDQQVGRIDRQVRSYGRELGLEDSNAALISVISTFITLSLAVLSIFIRNLLKKKHLNAQLAELRHDILQERDSLEEIHRASEDFIHEMKRQELELETTRLDVQKNSKLLIQSIDYAQLIQRSILPDHHKLEQFFTQSFILLRPLDIVSGDLPWFFHTDREALLGMVSCSGTGVSAASLTMMTYIQLNHVVEEQGLRAPSEVVFEVIKHINELLSHTTTDFQHSIKISLSVLRVNSNGHEAQFAGVGIPLLHSPSPGVIERLDAMPSIEAHREDHSHALNEVNVHLTPHSTVYLASEGYYTQPNADGKAIGLEEFCQILAQQSDRPLRDQRSTLLSLLLNHQQGAQQIDDITLIGATLRARA